MERHLCVEWRVELPDDADEALMRELALVLVPKQFHGLTGIVGRVYIDRFEIIEEDDSYGTPS